MKMRTSYSGLNDFQLTKKEANLIKQHLNRIVQIDRQMAGLRADLETECNALETAWENTYRRNLLDKLKQGIKLNESDFHVPPAIENGELKLIITEEHRTRVVKNG